MQLAARGGGSSRGRGGGGSSRSPGPARASRPARSSRPVRHVRPPPGPARELGLGLGRGDLPASLVIVFPLLLCYQLAIVVVPSVAATDPISRLLYAACGGRTGYLLAQAALAVAFLWWIRASGRARTLSLAVIAPVLLEAAAIAVVLWLALPLLLHRALGLGLGTSAASALGAGIYEEATFRLLVTGGAFYVALAIGLMRREAALLAVLIGALTFAAAHHLGAAGEPFGPAAFCFRVLAGVALGATCWFRSFAHAVYAHAAYDLLILLGG